MVVAASICDDPGMRQGWVWAVLGAAFSVLASCAKPAKAAVHEDVLVLEVGGQEASLREVLQALGRDVGPGHRLRPVEEQPEPRPVDPSRQKLPVQEEERRDPQPEPPPPQPEPEPEPESEWVTVELPKGETLIHVARRHLGNGTRWGEIVEWNGFTAAQLKRLRIGHPIKLKRSELK